MHEKAAQRVAANFLNALLQGVPDKIHTVLAVLENNSLAVASTLNINSRTVQKRPSTLSGDSPRLSFRKRDPGEAHYTTFVDVPLLISKESSSRLRYSPHERVQG